MKIFLGERLRAEREKLELSQAEFAALAGASKRSQLGWEQGRSMPDATYLTAIAAAGADVQYVLIGERLQEELRANYQLAAIATLKVSNPELAEAYVNSLPKLYEKQKRDEGAERELLESFRQCTNEEDRTSLLRMVKALAKSKAA